MKIGMTRKGFIGVVVAGMASMIGLSVCYGGPEEAEAPAADEQPDTMSADSVASTTQSNDSTTAYTIYPATTTSGSSANFADLTWTSGTATL
jgi:hypothetical protein